MDPLKLVLNASPRGPEAVLYIDALHCKMTISPRTVSAFTESKFKPAKTVQNRFGLKNELYAMRRNHTVSIDGLMESADSVERKGGKTSLESKEKPGVKTSRVAGNEKEEHRKLPQVPFLGVNFEKVESNTWKPVQTNPIRIEKRENAQIRNSPGPGKPAKITLVTVGEDLKTDKQTHLMRNEQFLAWATYHTEVALEKKPVMSRFANKTDSSRKDFPAPLAIGPAGASSKTVRTAVSVAVSPVTFSSETGPGFPMRKETILPPRILHVSSQPSPGFLSGGSNLLPIARFPLKPTRQKQSKTRCRSPNHIEPSFSLSSKPKNFASFPRRDESKIELVPMNPETMRRSQEFPRPKRVQWLYPRDLPSHRIPVDFNLFRNVHKSSSHRLLDFQRYHASDV